MKKTVKLLLYCTKAKPNLMDFDMDRKHFNINYGGQVLNGKIVAEAECDLVEEIKFINDTSYGTNTLNQNDLLKKTCLGMFDLYEYLYVKDGYAIYLKNVKPFEEPKQLSEYYRVGYLRACDEYDSAIDSMRGILAYCPDVCCTPPTKVIEEDWKIKNAPQNMCYCEDEDGDKCVLISIRPEWLCKILNGEKTIEIRKSILNIFKELIPNDRRTN